MLLGRDEQLALITGFEKHLDSLKKEGILEAWKEVGLPPQRMIEYPMSDDEIRAALTKMAWRFWASLWQAAARRRKSRKSEKDEKLPR